MLQEAIDDHHYCFQNFQSSQYHAFRNPFDIYDFESMNTFISAIFFLDE